MYANTITSQWVYPDEKHFRSPCLHCPKTAICCPSVKEYGAAACEKNIPIRGIDTAQARQAREILAEGPQTVTVLCLRLGMTRQATYDLLRKLRKYGQVESKRGQPQGGRGVPPIVWYLKEEP